jgi:hypothetical protein
VGELGHALAAHAAVGHLDAAAVADHALVLGALVFSAEALPVLLRAEAYGTDCYPRKKLEKETDNKVTLIVGAHDWPYPVPIVKKGETWVFDTMAGREELLNPKSLPEFKGYDPHPICVCGH